MHDNISRRHWLLALLTGLLGAWLRPARPEAPAAAAAPAAPPVPAAPPFPLGDPLAGVTTYTYDGTRLLTVVPGQGTTYAYDASGLRPFPRGGDMPA